MSVAVNIFVTLLPILLPLCELGQAKDGNSTKDPLGPSDQLAAIIETCQKAREEILQGV
ncbi:hypothetical protein SAMN05444166_6439 [Singulisphaera sp. GP187]|uniref:hypothetical protein n=1 Tax=Singulisphaera sp. GP187 TaxID=1882752 RepID=UPI00092AD766|nr:hypothetical protein [Singulisphaera sp. GP187]SIO60556.1 hypothetical protein SAMN05444166_6439 [Singulisphaera sp. GP187]